MPIDTAVPGDPNSVITVATWLGYSLARAVLAGADTLGDVRRNAESDWDGQAGQAFADRMGSGRRRVEQLNVAIVALAREIEALGHAIRIAHERMAAIRVAATASGLTVEGPLIVEPSPAPTDPGPLFAPVINYQRLGVPVPATGTHQSKTAAYATAVADAAFARDQLEDAKDGLDRAYRGLAGPEWGLTAADIAGGFRAGAMKFNAGALRQTAKRLHDDGATALSRALANDPTMVGSQSYYRDLDEADRLTTQGDDLIRQADDLDARARSLNAKIGGAVALAGVGYDLYRGKEPTQAAAAGAGSFAASVAAGTLAGAAIGSVIPIPGAGTVGGAIVGTGVGIVTSAAIDSLFEDGPNVKAAASEGWDALLDTGSVIAGPVVGVAKSIGGWLS
ncbi:MAG: hypothetical protein ACT4PP_02010 [Sporichthyaceae bacterium]